MSLYQVECPFCGQWTDAELAEAYSENPWDRACPQCWKGRVQKWEHEEVCQSCGQFAGFHHNKDGLLVCGRCFIHQ